MSKAEEQILLNQIMIMEALMHALDAGGDNGVEYKNLRLYRNATYEVLKEIRSNEHDGE